MPQIHPGIKIKTKEEVSVMAEGGKKLAEVKNALVAMIKPGVTAADVEKKAEELINASGGKASFKMVPGYSWCTCVNVNAGIVHGIPRKDLVFEEGDLVSVDVGLYYKGFHTDTSISVYLGKDKETRRFFDAGIEALSLAIKKVKPGNYIYDISEAIEATIEGYGYSPVRALVGHGVGKNLHEDPAIPCFTEGKREDTPKIVPGMVIAIEVMYALGNSDLVMENDEWTITTSDGKISALFEETVAATENGHLVITR